MSSLHSAVRLVDLVAMSEVPHPIPFRTRSLSPPEPMVLRLKARESRSPPGLPGGQRNEDKSQIRTSRTLSSFRSNPLAAGWSSPVARQAHNLKVVGSNPTPATNSLNDIRCLEPDLNSRVFACPKQLNATSTFDESPLKSGGLLRLGPSAGRNHPSCSYSENTSADPSRRIRNTA